MIKEESFGEKKRPMKERCCSSIKPVLMPVIVIGLFMLLCFQFFLISRVEVEPIASDIKVLSNDEIKAEMPT
jgi:hypothetical protein